MRVGLLARGAAVRGGILDLGVDVDVEAVEEAAVERVVAAVTEVVVAEVVGVLCLIPQPTAPKTRTAPN